MGNRCCSCVDHRQQEPEQHLKSGTETDQLQKDAARQLELQPGIEMVKRDEFGQPIISENAFQRPTDLVNDKTKKYRDALDEHPEVGLMGAEELEMSEKSRERLGGTKRRPHNERGESAEMRKTKKTDSGQKGAISTVEDINPAKLRILFGKYSNVNNGKVLDDIIRSFYAKKEGETREPMAKSVREAVNMVHRTPSPRRSPRLVPQPERPPLPSTLFEDGSQKRKKINREYNGVHKERCT